MTACVVQSDPLPGPTGERGPIGPKGESGPKGEQGPQGSADTAEDILDRLAAACPDPAAPEDFGFCIWQIGTTEGPYTYQGAAAACAKERARLCSLAELSAAQAAGANWCETTWLADRVDDENALGGVPRQTPDSDCCNKVGLCLVNTPMTGTHGATCCRP